VAVVGIGIDVVDLGRFTASLQRTPRLAERLFTPAERTLAIPSLAARFAAKEAVAKALGAPGGLRWHDAEIVRATDGRPTLRVTGTVAAAAAGLGVCRWHLSLAHDGPVAVATVVAES
jgi:holo-[acyl-carrier protein] synthase